MGWGTRRTSCRNLKIPSTSSTFTRAASWTDAGEKCRRKYRRWPVTNRPRRGRWVQRANSSWWSAPSRPMEAASAFPTPPTSSRTPRSRVASRVRRLPRRRSNPTATRRPRASSCRRPSYLPRTWILPGSKTPPSPGSRLHLPRLVSRFIYLFLDHLISIYKLISIFLLLILDESFKVIHGDCWNNSFTCCSEYFIPRKFFNGYDLNARWPLFEKLNRTAYF